MSRYDVFLSHSSAGKPLVDILARKLRNEGFRVFFDAWELVPGEPWQESLEEALEESRTCAVFLGPEGLGPWQNEETRAALDQRVREDPRRVIPVLLPGAHGRDVPVFLRRLTWVDFRKGPDDDDAWRRLVAGVRGVAPGVGTAEPAKLSTPYRTMAQRPEGFVHRRELDEMRELLCAAAAETSGVAVGITTALRGAGGFGKTTLAQALAFDDRVRTAFPEGVLWATMGENLGDAGRLLRVQGLIKWWDPREDTGFPTLEAASSRLREILAGRRVLIVVDDVWHSADVRPFLGVGAAVLVTTRDGRTLPSKCRRVDVDAMRQDEAVEILASGLSETDLAAFGDLAARLGEWPLLLKLVNRQLRRLARPGADLAAALEWVDRRLAEVGFRAFEPRNARERQEAVSRTLEVSLAALDEKDRQRFEELAVFPEDVDVPIGVLARFWDLGSGEAETLCGELHDLSLLLRYDWEASTVRLHDVFRTYLRDLRREALPDLHRQLLERCRPPDGRWAGLPAEEGYLWRYLAHHLIEAGERDVLRELLFDFGYLAGKIAAADVNALLADYDVLEADGPPRTVQGALRLSAHVLAKDAEQLAGQLLGRIAEGRAPEQDRLLREAKKRARLRPRRAILTPPGGPLVRTLEGHKYEVNAVAVLDNHRVVSASGDYTLRVWDIESGNSLRTLGGHTDSVRAVAVLDAHRVVSASEDRTLRVWDIESGDVLQILEGHTGRVGAVAVLDARRVLSASEDHTLRVWDIESRATLQILEGHTDKATAVAVLGARRVVSASEDCTLRVWDINSGATLQILEGHTFGVLDVAVVDSDRVVSASEDFTLRVWDIESGETLRTLEGHNGEVSAVALLDARHIVSASQDRTLRVWDLESGNTLRALDGHTYWVLAVAALDSHRVVSAAGDTTLRVWDLATGATLRTRDTSSGVLDVAVIDAHRVVSTSWDATLRVWDVKSGELLRALEGHKSWVRAVAVLDTHRVVSASGDGTVRVWDVESGEPLRALVGHESWVNAVAVLDTHRVVSASNDDTLRVWDLDSGDTLRTLLGHTRPVLAVAVLDNHRVVSASEDQTLRVWDLESGDTLRTLEGHTEAVSAVAVLDAHHVISASKDKTLRIWDVEFGDTWQTLVGHTLWVNTVAVLDAQRVVSGSDDNTLRVWDLYSGETIAAFTLDAPAEAVAITQDGRTLLVGDGAGGVHFLDLVD